MKENNITIDINKLNEKELEALAEILYRYGYAKECKEVNERKIFITM